jgi:hypothetical protein
MHSRITLGMTNEQKEHPYDMGDEEWNFCVAYLTLMKQDKPQCEQLLRELFRALTEMM